MRGVALYKPKAGKEAEYRNNGSGSRGISWVEIRAIARRRVFDERTESDREYVNTVSSGVKVLSTTCGKQGTPKSTNEEVRCTRRNEVRA